MASRRKRLARQRSTSASLSRSRSATPQRMHSSQRPSAARRALLMGLSLEEKRPVSPVRQGAQLVSRTPGGSVNLTGKSIAIEKTPGGHVRMAKNPEQPLCSNVLERVEAMDLSEEEAEEVMQSYPWFRRWLSGLPTVTTEGRECSSANPVTRSNSAEMNLAKASGTVSVCAANPNSSESMVKVTSAAVVRPSTSGVTATSKPNATGNVNEGSELDSEFDDEFDESPVERTDPGLGLERDIPDDEDLAEPVRNIINEVERAMDDAADRLPGVLTSFEWTSDFESFRGVPEVFSGPAPGPLKDYETPYDAFTDIWSMDFIERIAQETNRYAKQTIDSMKAKGTLKPSSRLHRWKDTDADEILVLFAVYMYMAIDPRTSQDEYWMADDYLEMPKFRQLMSYNRYILLSKFLHFVDNSDVSQDSLQNEGNQLSPKLAKLEPVISHLNKKFSSLYNLEREISIDESLTLFKGRLSWVQTIRTKAARFGIKSYELCESHTGYLYNFQIYTGKSSGNVGTTDVVPSADLGGKTTKIVLDLLKDLENLGHCVTMDNFYNCPALARYLKSLGIDCLGTLRTNRRNVPEDVKVPKNVAKGKIVARHCGDVSVLAWKDSKVVTMISTYHNDETFMGSKANKPLVKPKSVGDYNNTMGGVDLKDQKLSMYLLERKRALKWYVKMFKRLLNVSIHNAFVMMVKSLRRNDKLPMTHREFRYKLAKTLVDKHRRNQPEIRPQVEELTRLRRDIVHEPKYTTGSNSRRRCHICHENGRRKLVHSQCVTCDEFLCFENCWKDWHSLPKLKSEKPRGRKRSRNEN